MELTFLPETHTMPYFDLWLQVTIMYQALAVACMASSSSATHSEHFGEGGVQLQPGQLPPDPGTFCAIGHRAQHLHQGGNPSRAVLLRDWLGISLHVVPLHQLVLPVQNLCWQHMALLIFLCWIPHKITPPRPQHKLLVLQKIWV